MSSLKDFMRKIKKYANRKLYDTVDKKYISMKRLTDLIKGGEEVTIIDNQTNKDITSLIVSELLAREKKQDSDVMPAGTLIQMLRKGGGTIAGYAKKYTSLWQNAVTMAEDEVDKVVKLLIKDKEISESDGNKLKKEILSYADNFKVWISDKIDHRINEVLNLMNLATKEQVNGLSGKLDDLIVVVNRLEDLHLKKNKNKTHVLK